MNKALDKRITKLAEERVTVVKRRDALIREEKRRIIRYWCFRFQTEEAGDASADDAPTGLKKHFEKQDLFSNWKNFAIKWDVDKLAPYEVVRRTKSIWREWDDALVKDVPILPSHVER